MEKEQFKFGDKVMVVGELTVELPGDHTTKCLYLRPGTDTPRSVYIPREILSICAEATTPDELENYNIPPEKVNPKVYTCTCGKIYDKPIQKAMCVRRKHVEKK